MSVRHAVLRTLFRCAGATAALVILAAPARAQYFGQNKVQYEDFDFRVLHTAHFDIHYYPEEAEAAADVARMAERWYSRLSNLLGHELRGAQPIVLYASHPQFEQTNVVEEAIDEATGGVTEGQLRRVILPLAASLGETDHVLGHELVHAFQYDILGNGTEDVPLWFVEGMAEYLSRGPRDVETSMWLRDALLREKLPAIKDLDSPKYFPYRFGDAFWAYVGGRWGDRTIGAILRGMASPGGGRGSADPMGAIERATGLTIKDLSDEWQAAIRAAYGAGAGGETGPPVSQVFGKTTGYGRLNVGPALSPDGTRVAFLSGRDQVSIDLYLADVATGRVTRKLVSTGTDPHFDSLQFIASAGAWDPAGREIALATVRRGRPVLALIDGANGAIRREIPFPALGEIFQPAWSPDGRQIAFSAQVGGVTDLFVYDLQANQLRRLTTDPFADLEPAWTPDGRRLTFVTDRDGSDLAALAFRGYHLASIDLSTGVVTPVATGLSGNAYNPQWSGDGTSLYFVGDAGGRPDAYQLTVASGRVARLTREGTGVAGITPLSPALSVAPRAGVATLSVFRDGGYDLQIVALPAATPGEPPSATGPDEALLPPRDRAASVVAGLLADVTAGLPPAPAGEVQPYTARLHVLGVGQQAGVTTSSGFGTYVTGGVSVVWTDLLGNHLLGTTAQVNGGARDIGGQVEYLNRTSRWNWGLFGGLTPWLSASAAEGFTVQNGRTVFVSELDRFRETDAQVGALTAYPLSRVTRLELSAAAERIGFSQEVDRQTFDAATGILIGQEHFTTSPLPSLRLMSLSAAFVRDTAAFGATGPILGTRFRLAVAPSFGDLRMTSVTADYRRYVMPVRPVTLAGRLLHIARYGSGGEDARLFPLFLGYPDLVRGYGADSFQASECTQTTSGGCPEFDRLFGSRLFVASGEIRAPLAGLFTGQLTYGPLPVEVFGFADAGVAWTSTQRPVFAGGSRPWITSVGAGARVNLLGFAILEFDLARPLQRPLKGWTFVFVFGPAF